MIFLFSKKDKSIKCVQGFTLVEIILVMFLVSFAFTGIYTLLAKTAQHEKDNRYAVIASNLAQEGVEIIRNRRDENLLNEVAMNVDLSAGICCPYWEGNTANCDNDRTEEVEIVGDAYRNCVISGCTGEDTIFKRDCDIITSGSEEMEISCEVSWDSPSLGILRSVIVESYLTNWQENI